ncbi:DUF2141 domain-containing protein [Terasakiella sp. A23]|uniref:DUF2141 domain-containing protein n=1 Tax=Terasakiella sp. FCG-A23 TaxID=3080561 RepID=UPI0029546EDB|nr:DUF2141 domain-containing protein [Terasakiella sp. A23]MDV7340776.1 DUF2141 domain-containing protein [Terasakiella sp. A23]
MLRLAFLTLFLGLSFFSPSMAASDLKVIIGDVSDYGGKLRFFIHNEQSYPLEEEALLYMELKPREGDMVHHITGLKKGRYAIIVHHDDNQDNEFNTNQFGMGEEGVGYTNDPRLTFGMPEFEDVWFNFDGTKDVVVVYMTY